MAHFQALFQTNVSKTGKNFLAFIVPLSSITTFCETQKRCDVNCWYQVYYTFFADVVINFFEIQMFVYFYLEICGFAFAGSFVFP